MLVTFTARSVPALLAVLVLAPAGALSARAQDEDYDAPAEYEPADDAPVPSDYGQALEPYGTWVEDDQYGEVWQPAVSVGWAPYTEGDWAWTPYGWTWASSEPWGWTFHYGRWVLLPTGWAWVPGSVWGPAWVDWFWGDGFVGWAPLPPFATEVTIIELFVFVHDRDFCSHGLDRLVVDHRLVPDDVVHRWQHRDRRSERPPPRGHIERVSRQPVTHIDRRPPGTLAPRGFDAARIARPGSVPRLGRARRGVATLGHPWEPGRVETARPTSLGRPPALARPPAEPRLGATRVPLGPRPVGPPPGWTVRRGGVGRQVPPAQALGVTRPAPPAVPGGATAVMPRPGLLGAHHAPAGHAPERPRAGGGTQTLAPGAIVRP